MKLIQIKWNGCWVHAVSAAILAGCGGGQGTTDVGASRVDGSNDGSATTLAQTADSTAANLAATTGLKAEYFSNESLSGTPTTRVDGNVDYNWARSGPSGVPADNFSVRWSGYINIPTAGFYAVGTESDDGVRLWVDDAQVVDRWNLHSVMTDSSRIYLTAGAHAVRMEYFERSYDAVARLLWQPPGTASLVAVPSSALSPTLPTAGAPAVVVPSVPTGDAASIGTFSAAEMDRLLEQGKVIWRAQRRDINGINKGACANCHSSNGIELALYKFKDGDILRRAQLDGVSPAEQETLVKYFAALRQYYKITALRDVLEDRPFQPKGQPFSGTVAERDYQFATKSLAVVAPTLMNGTIDTLAKALKAKEELRLSNPLDVQIGIPLPRLSEDCSRGAEHCTANDWMADLPRIPKPEMSAQWFALNDEYIANPTDANLRAILSAVETMTDSWKNPGEVVGPQANNLGTLKFKSMQIAQHYLRRQQQGLPTEQNPLAALKDASQGLKRPNFPFLVGDFAFNKFDTPWKRPNEMPVFVRSSLGETATRPLADADVQRVKDAMATPWWYLGFMLDANLGTGTNREYFFGELPTGPTAGYPFHELYAVSKHGSILVPKRPVNAESNIAFSSPAWRNVGEADQPRLFSSIEARQLYRRLESNWTLMWMLLAREQIDKSGVASFGADSIDISLNICAMPVGTSANASLRKWVAAATSFDPANAQFIFNLYNDLITKANCGLAPLTSTYQAGTGTGLKVEWIEGPGDEFNGKSASLGKVVGQRVEPIISFGRETGTGYYAEYTKSLGVNIVEGSAYSARGTGFVTAPVSGEYEFFLSAGFGKLFVNGKEIYNEFRYNEDKPLRATVTLQAGQRYPILFERHGCAACGINLEWRTLDGKLPRQKVPTQQLEPT